MVFLSFKCLPALYVAATAALSASTVEYDYIIVGGGTAGCVLANRLSKDPSISVAVIESGPTVFNDSRVLVPTPAGPAWGTELDWNYTTTPRIYANNSVLPYHAGRDLGGTSTINGLVYLRPSAEEINAWSALGNPGLSWDNLLPFFKKSEQLEIPTASQFAQEASYEPSVHGFIGPVNIGWSKLLTITDYVRALNSTWQSIGLSWNNDPNTGSTEGLAYFPSERDVELDIREDSARAYCLPVLNRPNLHILTNTTASKVDLSDNRSRHPHEGAVAATGVEILSSSGETQVLRAKLEVILSAGALRTPGLLERSGVGNPSVLRNLSITPKVVLPGVGAHLQDQWLSSFVYNLNFTYDELVYGYNAAPLTASLTAADLFGDELKNAAAQLRKDIPSYARILSQASGGAISVQAQEQILRMRADLIFEKGAAIGQVQFQAIAVTFWGSLPFSTGTVHSSADPSAPNINPNYLQLPWDILVQQRLSMLIRKVYASPNLISALGPSGSTELVPGLASVPLNATVEQYGAWFKQSVAPAWHAVGTAGMRRRDWGGVVDTKFRVYGVKALRVVDASVIPLEVNGNPTSTIYALAEKAAEDILAIARKVGGRSGRQAWKRVNSMVKDLRQTFCTCFMVARLH